MSKELAKTYDPKQIEEKMYEKWCENKYFHAQESCTWVMHWIIHCRIS